MVLAKSDLVVADVDMDLLKFDETNYPAAKTGNLYAHLVRYLGLVDGEFPAVAAVYRAGTFVVTRGHKYVKAAQELGRFQLPTVVNLSELDEHVRARFHWRTLPEQLRLEEEAASSGVEWHVFHFGERELSLEHAGEFLRRVQPILNGRMVRLDFGADAIDISCPRPTQYDERKLFAELLSFSAEELQIVSYQGAHFGPIGVSE
ncbi:MAG: hypothetical protein AAFN41_10000 [Planctomycetota bacterium]